MAPRPRNPENRSLPKRWRFTHGAYYYCVPTGVRDQWDGKALFLLGHSLAEAYRVYSERINTVGFEAPTMAAAMDRYLIEYLPTKAPRTQAGYKNILRYLRPVFGSMPPDSIEPHHAYRAHDAFKREHGATMAKHCVQVLRHVLTMCVRWGIIKTNPLLGQVRIESPRPRDRLIEDWEIDAALALRPKDKRGARIIHLAQCYIRLKLLTGLRRTDLLNLRLSDLRDDGIHVQPSKTKHSSGRRQVFEWGINSRQRAVIDEILRIPPRRIGDAPLFVTREGKPYIHEDGSANAFDSLWQRFMDRVLRDTAVEERFWEKDLRAKVASDSATLQKASDRLGHATTETTKRVYRRKPVHIKPMDEDD